MRTAIVFLALSLLCPISTAAENPVRAYADTVVSLLEKMNYAELYQKESPAEKAGSVLTAERIAAIWKTMESVYGQLQTVAYSRAQKGINISPLGRRPIFIVWYKVTTDKYHDNVHFLRINVTLEGGQLFLEGFSLVTTFTKSPQKSPERTHA